MAIVTTDNKHYKSIAQTIRIKTGNTTQYSPEEMAEGVEKVYDAGNDAGYDAGFNEGWRVRQDSFWYYFQSGGFRRNYNHAFYAVSTSLGKYTSWTDDNFNPKYPIVCTEGLSAEYMLAGSNVTRIDVPVKILVGSCARSFFNNPLLHTIKSLEVNEKTTFTGWFEGHTALRNITISDKSVIGNSISFKDCPLSLESAVSVINALKSNVAWEKSLSVSFSSTTKALLDEAGDIFFDLLGENRLAWWEYLATIGWNS